MKKLYKKIIPLTLAIATLMGTACSKKAKIEVYDGYELHYQATDGDLANFLNNFAHRNLRYDDYSAGKFAVGRRYGLC
ncbi:MAG: hypothetical protein IJW64_02555 [Clostridia bacterium]|nr:hypothetical protein [Clostridia bacterium]